jgi:hypothetical protein
MPSPESGTPGARSTAPQLTSPRASKPPIRGQRPGDRRVRIRRAHEPYFHYASDHSLIARPAASTSRTTLGRSLERIRSVLFGRPLSTHEEISQRLNVATGLSIFASDNISSSAYATEEIMRVLALAGAGALALTMPITIGIVIVLAIVVTSYRQTIAAYPNGGGSYIVASDNLGTLAGLIAAAALLTDYVLTVSVSVAAGVGALTSIVPELFEARVIIGVVIVAVIARRTSMSWIDPGRRIDPRRSRSSSSPSSSRGAGGSGSCTTSRLGGFGPRCSAVRTPSSWTCRIDARRPPAADRYLGSRLLQRVAITGTMPAWTVGHSA